MSTVYGTYPMASTQQSIHNPKHHSDKLILLKSQLERDELEFGVDSPSLEPTLYNISHELNLNGEHHEAYNILVKIYPSIEEKMGEAGCACLATRREYIVAAKGIGKEDEAQTLWNKGIEIVKGIDPSKKFREEQETAFTELGSKLGYEF